MTSKQLQYKHLLHLYDQKRMAAIHLKKRREEEIYQKIPDIFKIDESLKKTGLHLVKQVLKDSKDFSSESFRSHSETLIQTKKMLLVENGYPKDYLDIQYECNHCKDTGFIGNEKCTCFNQALINVAYTQSNLKSILQKENFETFSFEYYDREKVEPFALSAYQNMKNLYDICVGFVEKFKYETSNLLFYGPTGLGKTFLCNCIAKELLDKGANVLYLSSPELFKLFEESRFHREDMPEEAKNILDTLLSVDLLLIDDLGTEFGNSFTGPDLFHVLNTRFLHQKSTIISTNLEPNEWKNLYSERIVSRIFGHYTTLRLFGKDIRLMKKYHY
jgi:DNA replication protein DnaC